MAARRIRKLVLIEWLDSALPDPAWRYLSDAPALEVVNCVSVGWLVGDSNGVKMLAPNIGDVQSGESAQASGFIRIPTAAILRQVDLIEKT
jgi:hypothetical protein